MCSYPRTAGAHSDLHQSEVSIMFFNQSEAASIIYCQPIRSDYYIVLTNQERVFTFKTLTLTHWGQQSLSSESWTTLAGVGDEVVEWCPVSTAITVPPRTIADAKAEHEDDQY